MMGLRRWALPVAAVGVVVACLPPGTGFAATLTPNTPADEFDSAGNCSLREAVDRINQGMNGRGCSAVGAYGGADTIVLGAGTYTLGIPNRQEDADATGDLDATKSLVIQGLGDGPAGTTIDANHIDRAIEVIPNAAPSSPVNLTLQSLTVANGDPNGTVAPVGGDGGALLYGDNDGTLGIFLSTIRNHESDDTGGGVTVSTGDPGPTLQIGDSEFVSNTAGAEGGGLYLDARNTGSNLVSGSTFAGNSSGLDGGGVYIEGAGHTFTGIFFRNDTLTGNSATQGGGALAIGFGAGEADFVFSTIADNSTTAGLSGGIQVDDATRHVTLGESIIAGNTASGAPANCGSTAGPFSTNIGTAGVYSIENANTCALNTATGNSLINTNPLLAPLADNTGPTRTRGLYDGSPALDFIPRSPSDFCSQAQGFDQREVARPAAPNGLCDAGAFEGSVGPAPQNPPTTNQTSPTAQCNGKNATVAGPRATISGTSGNDTINGTPAADVIDGAGGNDLIRGMGGNDVICGDAGNDTLIGGGGKDKLLGGPGKDKLKGGGGKDTCVGAAGKDTAATCEKTKSI